MKIKPIMANSGYVERQAANNKRSKAIMCEKYRHNIKENNNDKINTTIKNNSDGRVSFNGGVPLLHRAAEFTSHNPLVAESIFAVLVTCGLRPLTIMASAHNEEDKSKCSYQAAKSISSGLVGLATTALVGTPIAAATKIAKDKGAFNISPEMKEKSLEIVKQGIDAIKENADGISDIAGINLKELIDGGKINLGVFKKTGKGAEKTFKKEVAEKFPEAAKSIIRAIKEQHTLDNYSHTAKNVADKMFQPIFMPIRATITIALVPIILGALGLKKSSAKSKQKDVQNPFQNMSLNVIQNTNDIFKSFTGSVK